MQFFTNNAINPCLSSTYDFIRKVVTTLISYHTEANVKLKILHLGGDEVPKAAWLEAPACQKYIANMTGPSEQRGQETTYCLKWYLEHWIGQKNVHPLGLKRIRSSKRKPDLCVN